MNIGYDKHFLGEEVEFPKLNDLQSEDAVMQGDNNGKVIDYINYSLVLSKSRGFPYFTASNIDGVLFKKAPRKDSWRKDSNVEDEFQWGKELYSAKDSDFDKGHMTKREDVQWGDTVAIASKAADSTFFYTNAVPQHANLNQKIWRSLEDYILHTETRENSLKVSVFTGPVLNEKDPLFVTPVNGKRVQIPLIFWKVVFFKKSDNKVYCAGFMMSQSALLFENGIVEEQQLERAITDEDELFMKFQDASTYQVNIDTIEKLTGLTLPTAIETYKDARKIKLVLNEIDVEESLLEGANDEALIGFSILGIKL